MQCTPHKGHHNGCWMASPQDVDRVPPPFLPLKPYVAITIQRFKEDECVQWWEIFNEPKHDTYSLSLRNEAYKWAKAVGPLAPVMSCWDDSNNTDIVDHHDYGTAFKTGWQRALYSDPVKGAAVTEGGSRWYQPDPPIKPGAETNQQDQGSPLTVLNFLWALRAEKAKGTVPYVPGVMVCWELMVRQCRAVAAVAAAPSACWCSVAAGLRGRFSPAPCPFRSAIRIRDGIGTLPPVHPSQPSHGTLGCSRMARRSPTRRWRPSGGDGDRRVLSLR